MKRRLWSTLSAFVILGAAVLNVPGLSAQTEHHGADSSFEKDGVAILWAILKGRDEDSSWVCIKIVKSDQCPFQFFSVEAVDPFSQSREWVVRGNPLQAENLVRTVRASFREKTSRRVLFYRNAENLQKERPAIIVFYLGVPDTSPEILSEKEMENYFMEALGRLMKK